MGLIFDRIETDNQIIIRYSRVMILFVALIFALIIIFLIVPMPDIVRLLALFAPAAVYFWDTRDIRPEIAEAKARGALEVTGSRFSLRNPHTVIIEKSKIM